jgi:hypothetical protein
VQEAPYGSIIVRAIINSAYSLTKSASSATDNGSLLGNGTDKDDSVTDRGQIGSVRGLWMIGVSPDRGQIGGSPWIMDRHAQNGGAPA